MIIYITILPAQLIISNDKTYKKQTNKQNCLKEFKILTKKALINMIRTLHEEGIQLFSGSILYHFVLYFTLICHILMTCRSGLLPEFSQIPAQMFCILKKYSRSQYWLYINDKACLQNVNPTSHSFPSLCER